MKQSFKDIGLRAFLNMAAEAGVKMYHNRFTHRVLVRLADDCYLLGILHGGGKIAVSEVRTKLNVFTHSR